MPGFVSYDDLISEMTAGKRLPLPWSKVNSSAPVAATWYHLWTNGGQPGPGVYGGTALAFQRTIDTRAGALYHGGNKAADTKHLAVMMALSSAGAPPPILMLVDMVGYYGDFTQSASSQNFDNTTAPDRYTSAGQSGLQAVLVATAAGGATASNLTVLTYVNQDGGTGRLMPATPNVVVTVSAAAPSATLGSRVISTIAGAFLPLQAGDCGIRQLTNITFSAANTGNESILLVRPLATIPCPSANVPAERDLVMQIANLERIYDGACLCWLCYFPAATAATLTGMVDVVWG